jgi:hypothetical protein
MWPDFDGLIDETDGTISFNTEEWSCTDPDTCQFCRKISDTEFEYIQLKEDVFDKLKVQGYGKKALDFLNGRTYPADWYQDIIDVDEYDDDEVEEYLAPYGYDFADFNCYTKENNQIIAECIFETDVVQCV